MSDLVAKLVGGNAESGYKVNVKTANPTGMIGDAGVIRTFETKEEAKAYAKLVNETGEDSFVKNSSQQSPMPVVHEGDTFIKS